MKLYHFKMFQGLAVNVIVYLFIIYSSLGWMAADVSYAIKKAMGCNTAENAFIVVLNMTSESNMTEALQKVGQMWEKDITSKTSVTMEVVMYHSM